MRLPRHVDALRAGAVVVVDRRSSNSSRSSSSSISAPPTHTEQLRVVVDAVAVRGAGQLIGAATPIPPLLVKVMVMAMVCPVPLHIEEAAAAHVVHTMT